MEGSAAFSSGIGRHRKKFTRVCMQLLSGTLWRMALQRLSSVPTVDLTALRHRQSWKQNLSVQSWLAGIGLSGGTGAKYRQGQGTGARKGPGTVYGEALFCVEKKKTAPVA